MTFRVLRTWHLDTATNNVGSFTCQQSDPRGYYGYNGSWDADQGDGPVFGNSISSKPQRARDRWAMGALVHGHFSVNSSNWVERV